MIIKVLSDYIKNINILDLDEIAMIEEISYKALAPIRKYIPSAGGLDFSPLFILIMINLLESFLTDILRAIV